MSQNEYNRSSLMKSLIKKDEKVNPEVLEDEDFEEVEDFEDYEDGEDIEGRKAEEREKCQAMSKDVLVEYLIQTKENLWCSHAQRDQLGNIISDKNKEIAELNDSHRELEGKISELKREIEKLQDEMSQQEETHEHEIEGQKSANDVKLENQRKDFEAEKLTLQKEYAAKAAEAEKKAEARADKQIKASEAKQNKQIKKLEDKISELESANLEGIAVKALIDKMSVSVSELNTLFAIKLEQLLQDHQSDIVTACGEVVSDSQKDLITKQEIRKAKLRAKRKLESKRAQKEDLDAEIAELEDFVEADEA